MAKAWNDGDYVGAPDLDEFTSSGNLVFATTTARDAFLVGDLAPQPGMFATTTSDGVTLKYVVVGGTGYWVPQHGYFLVEVQQATTHTLGASNTVTQITNLSTIVGRNYGTWFNTTNSRFQPLCPGFYEIDATVCFSGYTSGNRRLWLALNGTLLDATMTVWGTVNVSDTQVLPLRTCYVWMNGTTDYLTLMASHTAGATLSTAIATTSRGLCTFKASYAGV